MSDALEKLQHELAAAQRALAEAEARCARHDASHQGAATKQFEETCKKIERAHQEWESALDGVQDLVFMHDRNFNILRCNRAYQRCAGIPFEQIIGQPYYEVFPKTHAPLPSCLRTMEKTAAEAEEEEVLVGDTIYLSRSFSVKDEQGVYLYSVHTLEDITTRKQAAVALAIANKELVFQNEEKEKRAAELIVANKELQDSLEDTVRAIATIVEKRDPYTAGHQVRVADLATSIARQMGLPDEQVHAIRLAGMMHDLGKIQIPAEILSKPGKLTDIEYSLIKVHPQSGYDILKGISFPWPIAQMVLQHHERLDGSGYPQGLRGDQIILEARILGVSDVVEAMSSHRPYRPGLGIEVALAEITKQRGVYYDSQVVDACVALFREQHYSFKS